MTMQAIPAVQRAAPEQLQAQVVVVLLELRGLFKHLWTGGSTEGTAFEELRERAFGALSGYLRRADAPFRLGFALPEVLLGGALLRGTRTAYEAAYELGRQLEELGGSELTVAVDLTADKFAEVVQTIAAARRDQSEFSSPTPSFVLRGSRELLDIDDPESPEHVAHAYAASVVAMRGLLEQLEDTAVLPPRAKRIGHGLVDLSAERLSLLVSAASAPGTDAEPAGRAVNRAIYALALLRQFSADRRLLSHVAMAALLCEVGHAPRALEDEAVAAHTMAALMALGRLNEASVVRTVVAFETLWSESNEGPVYAGRRRTTLAARIVRVVRGYQRLVSALADDAVSVRIDALYTQCEDEIEQLLVCALAAALQVSQPAAALAAEEAAASLDAETATSDDAEASPPPASVLEVVDSGWSVMPPSLDAEPVIPPAETKPALESSPSSESKPALDSKPATESKPVAEAEAGPVSTAESEAVAPALVPPPAPSSATAARDAAPTQPPAAMPPADVPSRALEDREAEPTPSAVQAARAPTAQGNLATQPVPHVLLYALDQSLTGTLVFDEPEAADGSKGARHQLFLLDGAPAQAHLQLRVSRLGEVLSRLNLVSSSLIDGWLEQAAARERAGQPRMLLGELLLSKSVLSKDDLSRALEAQLIERLAALATLSPGTQYSFFADENLFSEEPGASELLTTSPLNALFATLRGAVDEERMMATLKRIWRIPLAFHPDADRHAYALTGEEEAVLERIAQGRPTLDELLADRRVSRPAAIQLVYFLAITRQLIWKGQKKGPIMPRGSRPKTGFSPPLPPRTVELPDDRVLSSTQHTKPRIRVRILTPSGSRMVESGLPTPPVMQAVRIPAPADSGYDVDVSVTEPEAESPSSAPPSAVASSPLPSLEAPADSIMVDPGAALAAFVTALRLEDEGDRAGAIKSLQRASQLDPDEPEYTVRLCGLVPGSRTQMDEKVATLHKDHPQHLTVALEWTRQRRQSASPSQVLESYRGILARDMAHAEAARAVFEIRTQLEDD